MVCKLHPTFVKTESRKTKLYNVKLLEVGISKRNEFFLDSIVHGSLLYNEFFSFRLL